jgi:hypothetical protein
VVGQVLNDHNKAGSVSVVDSEVDAGTGKNAAVSNTNVTIVRSNIHGGAFSVVCWSGCSVTDSWLHGQYMPPGSDWHLDGFLMNGGDHATVSHNTIACDMPGDGCSGAAALFGDFAPNSFVTFDRNLFVASTSTAYCTYGGAIFESNKHFEADHVVYTGNVFQRGQNGKCGFYDVVSNFDTKAPGNVWQGNTWDDGKPLEVR